MKKWLLALIILLIAAYLLIGYKIPNDLFINRITEIKANDRALMRAITEVQRRHEWWPKKGTDQSNNISLNGYRFSFTKINDSNVGVMMASGTDSVSGEIRLLKQPTDICEISWTCTQRTRQNVLTNTWYYLKAQKISKTIDELLVQLKDYSQNTERLYGYPIQTEHLKDDIVTVSNHIIARKDFYPQLHKDFKNLESYIHLNNLQATGNYMINVHEESGDSLNLMTGIPTNDFTAASGIINHTQMPPGGNMITASYKGMYKNRMLVFRALEQYVSDHELSKASLPYESIIDNRIPVSDSSTVEIKFFYPVF